MRSRSLDIEGAWEFVPTVHADDRGAFLEAYRSDAVADAIGHPFSVAQMNVSVSRRGVLRGIHYADVPPSQAKFVTCQRGAVIDFIVDIRVGSPTFGSWTSVLLDEERRASVYVSEGLGHAFMALTDDATVAYLVSEPFSAPREHGIHPLDPEIGLVLPPDLLPILSAKDAAAPTLRAALDSGILPSAAAAGEYRAALARRAFGDDG